MNSMMWLQACPKLQQTHRVLLEDLKFYTAAFHLRAKRRQLVTAHAFEISVTNACNRIMQAMTGKLAAVEMGATVASWSTWRMRPTTRLHPERGCGSRASTTSHSTAATLLLAPLLAREILDGRRPSTLFFLKSAVLTQCCATGSDMRFARACTAAALVMHHCGTVTRPPEQLAAAAHGAVCGKEAAARICGLRMIIVEAMLLAPRPVASSESRGFRSGPKGLLSLAAA